MATEKVKKAAELGMVLRAVRKLHKMRLDDFAGCSGVGHVFVREVEHGKETAQLGRVLHVLYQMGIHVHLSFPDEALAELTRLKRIGLRPLKRRRRGDEASS
jgi:transcriptional regulator with XRE-family HTH domain